MRVTGLAAVLGYSITVAILLCMPLSWRLHPAFQLPGWEAEVSNGLLRFEPIDERPLQGNFLAASLNVGPGLRSGTSSFRQHPQRQLGWHTQTRQLTWFGIWKSADEVRRTWFVLPLWIPALVAFAATIMLHWLHRCLCFKPRGQRSRRRWLAAQLVLISSFGWLAIQVFWAELKVAGGTPGQHVWSMTSVELGGGVVEFSRSTQDTGLPWPRSAGRGADLSLRWSPSLHFRLPGSKQFTHRGWSRRSYWFPIWPIAITGIVFGCIVWCRNYVPPRHCEDCNYDLTGNTTGTCPECGHAIVEVTR